MSLLTPFSKLPALNTATVLVSLCLRSWVAAPLWLELLSGQLARLQLQIDRFTNTAAAVVTCIDAVVVWINSLTCYMLHWIYYFPSSDTSESMHVFIQCGFNFRILLKTSAGFLTSPERHTQTNVTEILLLCIILLKKMNQLYISVHVFEL